MKKQLIQSLGLSAALVFSTSLYAGSVVPAAAGVPTSLPPGSDVTIKIAEKMASAHDNAADWQRSLLIELAKYDLYTPKGEPSEYVLNQLKLCQEKVSFDKGKVENFKCSFTGPDAGRDMLASSLLDRAAFETSNQRKLAFEYIKTVTNNNPMEYPGDKEVFKDGKPEKGLTDKGITYFNEAFKQLPAFTMAQNALLAIYAERDRLPGLAKGLGKVGDGNGNASILEIMNYEVERRYMNPKWYEEMNAADELAVSREIANLLAFQSYMQVKAYEQNARIEALLAAQMGAIAGLNAMMAQGNINTEEMDPDEMAEEVQ